MKAKKLTNKEIIASLEAGKTILVKGYVSSGDKSVSDVLIKHVGHAGYIDMVKRSIEGLRKVYSEHLEKNTGIAPALIRKTALDEVQHSLESKLVAKPGVERFTPDFIDDDGRLSIHRVEVLSRKVITKAASTVKSKDLTLCKNLLLDHLPVGRFEFRFNLYPGKYETVLIHEEEVTAG